MRLTLLSACAALAACSASDEDKRTAASNATEQVSEPAAGPAADRGDPERRSPRATGSGFAEGNWSYQVSAAAGVAAIFVSDSRERLRVGCRADPPSLFVTGGQSEPADTPTRIVFGRQPIDLEASDGGLEWVTALTPGQVDALDDGAVKFGEMTLPPISPDALAALKRGCSQVLAASTPKGATWTYSQAEGTAVLAFALPASDYPGPRFECRPGGGMVRLTLQAVRSPARRIVAAAGDGRFEGQVASEPDQLNGGEIWSTRLPADHGLLRGLEQSGELRIDQPQPRTSYASQGAARAVARFRAACAVAGR